MLKIIVIASDTFSITQAICERCTKKKWPFSVVNQSSSHFSMFTYELKH